MHNCACQHWFCDITCGRPDFIAPSQCQYHMTMSAPSLRSRKRHESLMHSPRFHHFTAVKVKHFTREKGQGWRDAAPGVPPQAMRQVRLPSTHPPTPTHSHTPTHPHCCTSLASISQPSLGWLSVCVSTHLIDHLTHLDLCDKSD